MIASSGRPCSDRSAQSCWLQPSREAASAKAEGAGWQIISSGAKRRASIAPTPKKNGSPLASTQTGLPAPRLDRVERVLDRRRPDERLGRERPGEREMAPAADDEGRLRDEAPRGRRKAVEPVLADADDARAMRLAAHGAAP